MSQRRQCFQQKEIDEFYFLLLRKRDVITLAYFSCDQEAAPDVINTSVKDIEASAVKMSREEASSELGSKECVELRGIAEAIERLKKGEFGSCVDCGDDISKARLVVSPEALRCIVCKVTLESSS